LREDASEVMNVLSEHIALLALKPKRYDKIIKQAKKEAHEGWPIVTDWVKRNQYLSWVPPKAGFLCFVKYDLPINSDTFCRALLKEPYQTLVQPGIAYGFENYLRVGVGGGKPEEIKAGLMKIEEFVENSL
jgi:aspartate/methionine/tyrosine aminotransferase